MPNAPMAPCSGGSASSTPNEPSASDTAEAHGYSRPTALSWIDRDTTIGPRTAVRRTHGLK